MDTPIYILYTIGKYLLFAVISFLVYFIYTGFIVPYLFWRSYKKYPNVYVSKKFIPLLGDLKEFLDAKKDNKVWYIYIREDNTRFEGCDLQVRIQGITPLMTIVSHKALNELISLQPDKIDRKLITRAFAKMAPKGFAFYPSTKLIKERRIRMTKIFGLNSSSRYINVMLKFSKLTLDQICNEKEVDIMYKMNVLTFMTFTNILFGKDVESLIEQTRPFINKNGTVEQLKLRDIFLHLTKDFVEEVFHPITLMFPFACDYNLAGVYRRNKKNNDTFKDACREIIKASKDKNSIANELASADGTIDDVLFDDLISIMIAGTETTSHSLVSGLFYASKHPEVYSKLLDELRENGFMTKDQSQLDDKFTSENLNSLTYLNNFVKEVFRYDSPVLQSFENFVKEDIEICGVPIKKGTTLVFDIRTAHFNDESWLNPLAFEPDRHDSNSEIYQEAKKQGMNFEAYARRTFSHGSRNCPGQTFATLEMKVVIAFMISQGKFKFDQKDIDNEGIGFGLGSHFQPMVQTSKLLEN
jgi:cytochrome P450